MAVELRDMLPQDYKVLSEAVDFEWKFSTFSRDKGLGMAEYYLLRNINGADHAVTMTIDGEPKGALILGGMDIGSVDTSVRLRELEASLSNEPGFDTVLKGEANLDKIYERIVRDNKCTNLARLRLLIICRDTKGYGLGRILMKEAERLVTEAGRKGITFYSDDECNFGFYEHIGAERIGSADTIYGGEPLTVYVYRLLF